MNWVEEDLMRWIIFYQYVDNSLVATVYGCLSVILIINIDKRYVM